MSNEGYETIWLEKFKIVAQQRFAREFLGGSAEISAEIMTDMILAVFRAYVWAEDLKKYEIRYPATWWDAFKERWFPYWAKIRWPIQWITEIIDIKALYPTLTYSIPEEPHVIKVLRYMNA